MNKKKLLILIPILTIFLNTNNTSAEIDYASNEAYYNKICSVRASYSANKQACDDYEIYKIKKSGKTSDDIETDLTKSRLNVEKLAYMVRKSNELLEEKQAIMAENNKKLEANKKKAAQLEQDIETGLLNMQEMSNANAAVDFVMGAANIEELVLRVEGLEVLNEANVDMLIELDEAKKEIEELSTSMEDDIAKIEKVKTSQEKLLKEFQQKEASVYTAYSQSQPVNYNTELNDLDYKDAEDKNKKWIRPVEKPYISAGVWAYPGGGWHPGLDLAAPVGTPVLAPADGYLLSYGSMPSGLGVHSVLIFKKNDKVYTMIFGHLKTYEVQTQFKQGEKIGVIGMTGNTTGPHTHVEVFQHNTDDIQSVIEKYSKTKDYYFGIGYTTKGDCDNVCRLNPQDFFGVKVGTTYK